MGSARYTVEVEKQLVEITQYIARDNFTAALSWLEQVRTACERLALQPELGELARTKRLGAVRRHVIGKYVIHYRAIDDGIEVVGVVHGARDPQAFH